MILDDDIRNLKKIIESATPEKRAYVIIKTFFSCEDSSEHIREIFHDWLLSEENAEDKEIALQKVFDEFFLFSEEESPVASDLFENLQKRLKLSI